MIFQEFFCIFFGAHPDIARWNACDVLADVQNGLSPYSFCGGNPILNVDSDGNIFETAWDAASLVMGVKSFVGNVRQGNVGAAILDGVGIVGDALSVATPFVPGGLSAGIAAVRIAKNADKVVDAVKSADKAVDAAQSVKMGTTVNKMDQLHESAVIGQEANRQIEAEIKALVPKANIESPLLLNNGKTIRKDAILPDGTNIIIKPNTKSGQEATRKRIQLFEENGYKNNTIIYYNPKDERWLPDSPTYIGPKHK